MLAANLALPAAGVFTAQGRDPAKRVTTTPGEGRLAEGHAFLSTDLHPIAFRCSCPSLSL